MVLSAPRALAVNTGCSRSSAAVLHTLCSVVFLFLPHWSSKVWAHNELRRDTDDTLCTDPFIPRSINTHTLCVFISLHKHTHTLSLHPLPEEEAAALIFCCISIHMSTCMSVYIKDKSFDWEDETLYLVLIYSHFDVNSLLLVSYLQSFFLIQADGLRVEESCAVRIINPFEANLWFWVKWMK